jgi:acyl-CoA hydrolase
MEIRINVTTKKNNQYEPVMVAYFVMVARDKFTNKAVKVNQLEPATEADRHLLEIGAESQRRRKIMAESSLYKIPPNEQERTFIHNIHLKLRKIKRGQSMDEGVFGDYEFGGRYQLMSSTLLTSTKIMHPTQRNIHNKIFGTLVCVVLTVRWLSN